MNKLVDVHVKWSVEKLRKLPSSGTYSTISRFSEDVDWPRGETWSMVLKFDPAATEESQFLAKANFLSPLAPEGRLVKGRVFELYEGESRTAVVTVL